MDGEAELRAEIALVCQRLWARGLIAGPDGNVSTRLGTDRVLITPAGVSKLDVRPEDILIVDLSGRLASGALPPSSEMRVHLRAYACRPDVRAVVHAHPPTATGFAVAGEDFVVPVLPEIILQVGAVPLVPYATPGTDALADAMEPYLVRHDAVLMANHGATTLGPSLRVAHQRMESLEHTARILLAARMLGRVRPLTTEQVRELEEARDAARRAGSARPTGRGEPGSGRENA